MIFTKNRPILGGFLLSIFPRLDSFSAYLSGSTNIFLVKNFSSLSYPLPKSPRKTGLRRVWESEYSTAEYGRGNPICLTFTPTYAILRFGRVIAVLR